jgi:SAM-dependent methyltransferase
MSGLETRFSGNVPENYDRGLGPYIFHYYAQHMADLCGALNPKTVLETAAGTGIVTKFLRDKLSPDSSLIATDLNRPMLDYAARKLGDEAEIEFTAADACELPFEDGQFDAVVCQFGVMFYPDRHAGYQEALRVLRTGGTYLFSVWDTWAENPFAETAYSVGAEFVAENPPAFYRVPFGYNDIDAIKEALDLAGFAECAIEKHPHIQPLADADLFASGIVYGNPLCEELIERGVKPEEVRGKISQALRKQFGESMPLQAIFISAKKG